MLKKMREALEIASKGREMVDAYVAAQAKTIRNLTDNPATARHLNEHARLAA